VFRAQRLALAGRFVEEDEGPGEENDNDGEGDEKRRVEPGSEDHGDVGGEAKRFDRLGHVVEQIISYL